MFLKIYIIMPAYNAGATIERTFDRIPDAVRKKIRGYVIVDDGSIDDTQAAIDRISRCVEGVIALKHTVNRGYGAAEKTLISEALKKEIDIAVLLHADGQYSPEKIIELLEPLERHQADLVQGSRMLEGGALKGGMPLYKYFSNKSLTALENKVFGMALAEYHSGFMLYSRRLLNAVPFHLFSDSFEFDLEMIIAAKILNFKIREVAIPTLYADETSHLNPIKYGLDVLNVIRKFYRGDYHAMLGQETSSNG